MTDILIIFLYLDCRRYNLEHFEQTLVALLGIGDLIHRNTKFYPGSEQ